MSVRIPVTFRLLTLASFIFCLRLPAQIVTTRCDGGELAEDATAPVALAYLDQDRQNLNTACIIDAIHILQDKGYDRAIPILVKYLDFKIPRQPGIPIAHMAGVTSGFYPAADALDRLGDASVPALKSAVKDDSFATQGRVNAAKVLFDLLHNEPQVIKFTAKVAQASQDSDAAEALTKLANDLVRYCKEKDRQQCRDAANGR